MTDSEKIIELASQSGMTGLSLIDIGYLEAFYRIVWNSAIDAAAQQCYGETEQAIRQDILSVKEK